MLTTPLIESFMAFQDETGISTETLAKAMVAVTEEAGENPLFKMERGEISEESFLGDSPAASSPCSATGRSCTASKRSTSRRSNRTSR